MRFMWHLRGNVSGKCDKGRIRFKEYVRGVSPRFYLHFYLAKRLVLVIK